MTAPKDHRTLRSLLVVGLFTLPSLAISQTLTIPGQAERSALVQSQLDSYALPVAPWRDGSVGTVITEGQVTKTAWKLPESQNTTLELLDPLRGQLRDEGFDILFECDTDLCGGFDFRYSIDILPEPEMHVNLGDFRFLTARRYHTEGTDFISLMVSRNETSAYLQTINIEGAAKNAPASTAPQTILDQAPSGKDLASQLEAQGHVILEDLAFETGSSELGAGPFETLTALADYLRSNPTRTVALVGHTDAEGALDGNVALSKKRAASVAIRLTDAMDVSADQIRAEGMGFLAPRATNLTDEGRTKNRRVEVILTSTQ
ncbi:MAG: OmpA family protein [Pseudoruegeria sp.]